MRAITSPLVSAVRRGFVGEVDALSALIKQLFGNGEQGAFYLPQPVVNGQQVLFQDAAGTIPVTADGDPVGLMRDISGNGKYATQTSSAARPVYRTDGILHWLESDGVDDHMSLPASLVEVDASQLMVLGVSMTINNGNPYLLGTSPLDQGLELLFFGSTARPRPAVVTQGDLVVASSDEALEDGELEVLRQQWDRSAGVMTLAQNGVQTVNTSGAAEDDLLSPGIDYQLFSADSGNPARCFKGRLTALCIVSGVVSAEDISELEMYVAQASGVTLP